MQRLMVFLLLCVYQKVLNKRVSWDRRCDLELEPNDTKEVTYNTHRIHNGAQITAVLNSAFRRSRMITSNHQGSVTQVVFKLRGNLGSTIQRLSRVLTDVDEQQAPLSMPPPCAESICSVS